MNFGPRPRPASLNLHLSHLTPHCPPPPPESQAAAEAKERAKKAEDDQARKDADERSAKVSVLAA